MGNPKRGAICVDDRNQLFIVVVDEPRPVSIMDNPAGTLWIGTVLVDGSPTTCAKPRVVANTFKEWAQEYALDVGVKAAKIEIDKLKKKVLG